MRIGIERLLVHVRVDVEGLGAGLGDAQHGYRAYIQPHPGVKSMLQ